MHQEKTILLVEVRRVTTSDLERLDYAVIAVSTKAEALSHLYAERFGLILMDVGLPDGDGLDISNTIRQDGDCPNQKTAIVVVTAHSTDEVSKQRCIAIGIQKLFIKPLTPDKLDQALEYFSKHSTNFL